MSPQELRVKAPRLSVVIAAFNAVPTLPDQLAALVAQRAPEDRSWEILVCDNGSTDDTPALVRRWAERHPAIRLVDAAVRRGPAAARNIGVAASRGELIAFCDADDVVADGWVDAVEAALDRHAFVAGPFEVERLATGSAFSVSWSPQTGGLNRIPYLPGFVTAGAGNMAMRREVFEGIGGFDESAFTAEDDDLCLRAQLSGHPLVFVPDMVLHVRKRSGLLATFRQARSYGVGARRLEARYALIAAELSSPPAGPAPEEALPPATPAPATQPFRIRITRVVRRLLRPATLANAVWRAGWGLGWRRAGSHHIEPLTPATLPTRGDARHREAPGGDA